MAEWGETAWCIDRKNGDEIKPVPIAKKGRIYITCDAPHKGAKVRMEDGFCNDHGVPRRFFPSYEEAERFLYRERVEKEIMRSWLNFLGTNKLAEMTDEEFDTVAEILKAVDERLAGKHGEK